MAKRITMNVLKQVIRLRCQHTPIKTIVRALGVARNTVKSYIREIEKRELSYSELLGMEDEVLEALFKNSEATDGRFETLQQMLPYFARELNRTGVNRWVLWNEYKQQHPTGYQHTQFCHYLQQYLQSGKGTLHIEQQPGDKLYIDFTGKKLRWVDHSTGEEHPTEVFVAVLGHSQLTYVEAVSSQKQEPFLQALDNALRFFGGVPKAIVPDNLKSAVIKSNRYEPEINQALTDLANHYQTTILPARSYKPRDKAWVENTIRTVYSRVFAPLRDQIFDSLEALNRAISQQLEKHNNQPFQGESFSRRQRFTENEQQCLVPLPAERYEYRQFRWQTVNKNGHIRIKEDKHYYSVPYRYIGRKVKVVLTQRHIALWYNGDRIALHPRDFRAYKYSTVADHLASHHRFVADWNADRFLQWAAGLHPEIGEFIKAVLDSKAYPEQAYRSCVGILAFEKKVGKQRLHDACLRAAHYHAFNYKTIAGILKNGLETDQPKATGEQSDLNLPDHPNIRGAENFE